LNVTSIYYLHEIGGKKNQEDYIWPVPGTALPENKIFIICDGVGGSENGEIASGMIAEYISSILLQTPPANISLDYINSLLEAAKQNLINHAVAKGLNKDMATTFTLLVLFNDKAFIAWCGDSRVYHIRNGEILYKTSDHSLVNSLVKKGEITEEDALAHPQKHIILKAISGDDSIPEAEGHWINDLSTDDCFMLCTDGLLENITDDDLKILLAGNSLRKDVLIAIRQKCFGKTKDNYSMYLLQISLQEKPVALKPKKSNAVLWMALAAITVIAGGLFFFTRKDLSAEQLQAPIIKHDSVIAPATVIVKKDTNIQPDKNVVPDSEIINKEEGEERKIIPAPLPETKHITDPVKKTDSLAKHSKPQK
jgi:PPM family protein phosphatase